ncbi:MAG: flagellar motor protein MotD [Bacteroidetes bacterium]|jgi:outer membrane protein OmpA-like peptidoglycan-associated protein|nr:flagellar motor protein MotD [Bacteroidota bacterium]
MIKRFIFLSLVFAAYTSVAQVKVDTLRLYFAINESESETNFRRIDSLITALNGHLIKVKITGYADFLHSNKYNSVLSQKRADNVKNYLLKKTSTVQTTIISCKGNGEKSSKDNGANEGEASQRRVDMIVERLVITETYDNTTSTENNYKKTQNKEPKKIEELSKGESMALEGLNFVPGRHFITKPSVPVLHKLLKTMLDNKSLKIEIQGHVCCTQGDSDGMDYDTHNYKLSENRARAIYDFLVSKGVAADRLSYKGYGHSKPKFPNEATAEEEQANRRVEILIIEK